MIKTADNYVKTLNYDLSYYECLSKQNTASSLIDFRKIYNGDCFSTKSRFSVNESFNDLILLLKEGLVYCGVKPTIICFDPHTAILFTDIIFVSLEDKNNDKNYIDLWTQYNRSIVVDSFGQNELIKNSTNI